jgi:hypothetical protein
METVRPTAEIHQTFLSVFFLKVESFPHWQEKSLNSFPYGAMNFNGRVGNQDLNSQQLYEAARNPLKGQ